LGIGPNPQSPIPNPQSPIPNPQYLKYFILFIIIYNLLYEKFIIIVNIYSYKNNNMGNCNKCDLGFIDSDDEINKHNINYEYNEKNSTDGKENNLLDNNLIKYKKYEPEIIFLQLKIRKFLSNKKVDSIENFYNRNYSLENTSNDNLIIITEENTSKKK
jgi:hypothetical protein